MSTPSEQRLTERPEFHSFIEQFDGVAVWSADESGLTYMSPAFEDIYGRPVEGVLDDMSLFLEFAHPDDHDRVLEVLEADEAYFLENGSIKEEFRIVRPDGEVRWLEVRMFPLESSSEGLSEVVGVTIDITDRKQTELELERQNERLDRFANVLSHDLRNPLNAAMGYLDLVTQEVSHAYLDTIHRSLTRIEEIITDVLTLARIGREAETTESVDLAETARHAWAMTGEEGGRLAAMDDLGEIEADESLVGQLFENAFRNAVEHGSTAPRSRVREDVGEHGSQEVTVDVGLLEDDTGFYIADDGPGVPESDRERVFEAGYSTSTNGTGYGLLIISEIVDVHGWSVRITDSEADGARLEIGNVTTNA